MHIFKAVLCGLICSIFLFSCSSSSKYYPVHNKAPRISSLGFYITPPPGRDWYEKHFEDSLYYFKNTKDLSYALTTQATELFFKDNDNIKQEILEYIKRQKQSPASGANYKNSKFDYTVEIIDSSLCVSYQHSYDDYGNKKRGAYPYVKIFNKGLVCRHPQSPRVGIDINYMEKSFPDVASQPALRKEGEHFISSLNFYQTSKN